MSVSTHSTCLPTKYRVQNYGFSYQCVNQKSPKTVISNRNIHLYQTEVIMKTFILVALFTVFTVIGCRNEAIEPDPSKKDPNKKEYMNTVTITGYDLRMCACCGGFIGNFKGDTNTVHAPGAENYLIDNTPEELGLHVADVRFPFTLNVDWEQSTKCTNERRIRFTKVYR